MAQAEQLDAPPAAPSPRSPLAGLFFSGRDNATTLPPPLLETAGETPAGEPAPLTTDPWPLADPESASGPEWTPDESNDEDESGTTSSRGSSGDRPGLKLGKAAARATGAKAVLMAGGIAHRMAARTEGQQAAELYLTDSEDAENIGHPLADIASRHGGVAGKALSPDANDALSALMGLANYATKQFARYMAAAQHDRALAAGHAPQPTPHGPEL